MKKFRIEYAGENLSRTQQRMASGGSSRSGRIVEFIFIGKLGSKSSILFSMRFELSHRLS